MFSKFRWIRYEPGQVENGLVIYRITSYGWKLEIPVPVKKVKQLGPQIAF